MLVSVCLLDDWTAGIPNPATWLCGPHADERFRIRVGLSARAFELSKLCVSFEHSRIGVWSGSVCAISSLGVDLWSLEFIYWKTHRQARTNEATRMTNHP